MVQIFDMKGERVVIYDFNSTDDHSLDVSRLSPGIYVARLMAGMSGRALGEIVFIKQ